MDSGRIEGDDPRLRYPTDRVENGIDPTMGSIIEWMTKAQATRSEPDGMSGEERTGALHRP
jgi:hypothetical protein